MMNYKSSFVFLSLLSFSSFASQATLSYETLQKINSLDEKGSNNWLSLNIVTEKVKKRFDSYMDLSVRFYHGNDKYVFSAPEAYLSLTNDDERWVLGRKELDWTPAENFWALGKLNALQGMTLLGKEQEGVTGLSYEGRSGGFKYSFIASYFFIPQLNPDLNVKDGKVVSSSDWVKLPPKKTEVNGQIVPIYYELQMPELSEILLRKTLGTNLTYEWNKGSVSVFTIYKPENKVRVNADAYYDQDKEQVIVKASPFVNHHLMYGLQTKQEFNSNYRLDSGIQVSDPTVSLGEDLNFLRDSKTNENRKNFESKYFSVRPSYEKESYAYMALSMKRDYYNFSFNAIELLTKNQNAGDDLYSEVVKWRRALGLGFGFDITENFKTSFSAQHDLLMEDTLIKNEFAYSFFGKEMIVAMGIELVHSPTKDSYWSAYRANDTVYSTLSYVF